MVIKTDGKISLLNLAKFFLLIYIFISKLVIPLGYGNGIINYFALVLMFVVVLFYDGFKPKVFKLLIVELLFFLITVLIGIVFAHNSTAVSEAAVKMFAGVILGYCIFRISQEDSSIKWIVKAWVVSAIVLALYVIVTGGFSTNTFRLTLREGYNSNTLGVYMMFAIWGILFLLTELLATTEKRVLYSFICILIIAMFLYVIVATASRKSLFASVFIIIFWLCFGTLSVFKQISFKKRLTMFLALVLSIAVIVAVFGSRIIGVSGTLLYRMQALSDENIGDMRRYTLIKEAFGIFLKRPLIGVGWDNFRFYSAYGQISHNSYVEVLACTGIVGSVFFYYIIIQVIKQVILIIKSKTNVIHNANIISLILSFFFICGVQVLFYNANLLFMFHLIFALLFTSDKNVLKGAE